MPRPAATPNFPARFHVAVDVLALTISRGLLQVAVVQRTAKTSCVDDGYGRVHEIPRTNEHFALPGGHVRPDAEDLEDAAVRELEEETGIHVARGDLIQLGAYGSLERDPRPGRTVSVAFLAFSRDFGRVVAGSDAARARFIDVVDLLAEPNRLEFDHERMLRDGIERLRELLERTPVATKFLDTNFTLSELRRVYEVVFHSAYDRDSDTRRYAKRLEREEGPIQDRQALAMARSLYSRAAHDLAKDVGSMPMMSAAPPPEHLARRIEGLLAAELSPGRASDRPRTGSVRDSLRRPLDAGNFARKVKDIAGFVQLVPGLSRPSEGGSGKPARLYQAGPATRLDPPLHIGKESSPVTKPSRRRSS